MEKATYKPFCKVIETYMMNDYLILVTDKFDSGDYRTNEIIQLRRPGFEPMNYQSGAVHFAKSIESLGHEIEFCLGISGLKVEDVPIGSEVWLSAQRPVRPKSRKYEYIGAKGADQALIQNEKPKTVRGA